MRRGTTKRLLAILLSIVMVAGMMVLAGAGETAQADTAWEKTVAGLSPRTSMCGPVPHSGGTEAWTGSYVWFGRYDGTPVKYRVLATETETFGGETMFLDCDNVLFTSAYDADYDKEWESSDLRTSLNSSAFLTKANGFTTLERNAIVNSYVDGHDMEANSFTQWVRSNLERCVGLSGEKIFVLDIEDVCGNNGYARTDYAGGGRVKKDLTGTESDWWLRTPKKNVSSFAGYTYESGDISTKRVDYASGVSPAMNIDISSIVFVSAVKGVRFTNDTEYKLTLKDSNMTASVTSGQYVSRAGNVITVPYTISGSNASSATQMSVLILNKQYWSGNGNNADILYYAKLSGSFSKNGTGTFTLPSGMNLNDWNSTYYVYILAEDVNDRYLTDYASSPVMLPKPVESEKIVLAATAKYPSIIKSATQNFQVVTTSDIQYLMVYAEDGTLVKTWAASGNSTVADMVRTWNVSLAINSPGNRNLVFKGGATSTTPVTNAKTASFKVESTGTYSASAKNTVIKKGGEQVFTVKTEKSAKYLMEYAEDGNLVKRWTASSTNSTVSGNVRTWTVSQTIGTAGKRNLTFKAGTTTTPTSTSASAAFTVEDVWVNSASAKFATIGKSGTQTFTVKTTSNAKYLMLYGEGGNLVKTWTASSSNSTVSGDVRTWTVSLAIGTVGNRELTIKAGKTTTPSVYGTTVKFTVVEKKLLSAKAQYAAILKGNPQKFEVVTSADVKNLMMYAEDGYLVKTWAASGNSTETAEKTRKWTISHSIGTTGNRKLTFKGGTTNTTPVTNALTVSFKVEGAGVLSASAKYATIVKGTAQIFTVKTSSDAKYLMMYGEGGNLVKTWTASSSNSTVSGSVRTWTVTQSIGTAGKRNLVFKAGVTSTPTSAQATAAFTVLASVPINETYFPDEVFREYVKTNFDTNSNGEFSVAELAEVTNLGRLQRLSIQSLQGIEFFSELTTLTCYSNPIEALDLSRNTKLQSLDCSGLRLQALDISMNTELTFIDCGFNQLTCLDVSKNTKLEMLYFACNSITELNLSTNTNLKSLYCYTNKIESLNLDLCTKLEEVSCHANKLKTLKVSANTALLKLSCHENDITELDVTKNKALVTLAVDSDVTVTGGDGVEITRY